MSTPAWRRFMAAVCLVSALTVFGWLRVAIDLLWRICVCHPQDLARVAMRRSLGDAVHSSRGVARGGRSTAGSCCGGADGQAVYACGLVGLPAEAVDLLVLGGDPGQCFGLEGGEVGDRLISSRESWFEGGDLVFESVDLGVAPVGVVVEYRV